MVNNNLLSVCLLFLSRGVRQRKYQLHIMFNTLYTLARKTFCHNTCARMKDNFCKSRLVKQWPPVAKHLVLITSYRLIAIAYIPYINTPHFNLIDNVNEKGLIWQICPRERIALTFNGLPVGNNYWETLLSTLPVWQLLPPVLGNERPSGKKVLNEVLQSNNTSCVTDSGDRLAILQLGESVLHINWKTHMLYLIDWDLRIGDPVTSKRTQSLLPTNEHCHLT